MEAAASRKEVAAKARAVGLLRGQASPPVIQDPAPHIEGLLRWFDREKRALPWRTERSPWSVWVAELMLQQTTAAVVKERLPRFLSRYPDLGSLAEADEAEVLKEWAGLGYYARARALHAGARAVIADHEGVLPADLEALKALPGIGDYTAGAILSFAFDRMAPAIDGNVQRVLSRLLLEERPVTSSAVKRRFEAAIKSWKPERASARAYNEAFIELGALICRPKAPICESCPLAAGCRAQKAGRAAEFPQKAKKKASELIHSHRALIREEGRTLFVRRGDDERRLMGFLELPGDWVQPEATPASALIPALEKLELEVLKIEEPTAEIRHAITTYRIKSFLHPVRVRVKSVAETRHWLDPKAQAAHRITTESLKLLAREPAP